MFRAALLLPIPATVADRSATVRNARELEQDWRRRRCTEPADRPPRRSDETRGRTREASNADDRRALPSPRAVYPTERGATRGPTTDRLHTRTRARTNAFVLSTRFRYVKQVRERVRERVSERVRSSSAHSENCERHIRSRGFTTNDGWT